MRLRDLTEKLAGRSVVFTFGRMNPPTIGHEKLINRIKTEARKNSADWKVYLSSTQDFKKNPLPFERKIFYARKMFGNEVNEKNFPKEPTALHAIVSLYEQGYKNAIMVVGSDRVSQFDKLLKTYNGVEGKPHGFYNFENIDVVSAGDRDPDAEGVSGMSASKLRDFAVQGKFNEFNAGLPGLRENDAKSLFNEIRKGLKLQAISEKIKIQKEVIPEKVTMKTSTFKDIFKKEKISENIMQVLRRKAEVSGIPLNVLKSIYEKAVKQYKLGHEIGQVKEQYAMQKVNTHLLENKNIDDTDEQFKEWMRMDEATDVVVSTPTGKYTTKTDSVSRTKTNIRNKFRNVKDRSQVSVRRATPRDQRYTDREPVQELDASTYHRASAKMADSDKPNKSDRALELRLKGNRKDRQDLEKSWKKGFARGKSYSQMMKQGGLSYREETEIQEMSRPHVFVGVKDTDPTSNLRPTVSYIPGKSKDFIKIKPVDTNFFNENLKELTNSPYEFLEELGLHTNFGILIRDKGNEKALVNAIAKKKSFSTSGYYDNIVYAVDTNENRLRKTLESSKINEATGNEIKKYMKSKWNTDVRASKVGTGKSMRAVGTIPNDFRDHVAKQFYPDVKILDKKNIDFGNIRPNYVSLRVGMWDELLKEDIQEETAAQAMATHNKHSADSEEHKLRGAKAELEKKRIQKQIRKENTPRYKNIKTEEAPPGREHQVKSLKKKVGEKKAYAFAWAQHNKHGLPDTKEEVELTEWEFDPNTLLQQLGGNKFMVMTGAKNLMVDKKEKSLHMRIGKNSKGINHLKITYMPDDTYTMDFGRIRKLDYKVVRSVKNVYAEALQDVFTEVTGMYTSL